MDLTLLFPLEGQIRIAADHTSPGKGRVVGTIRDLFDPFGDLRQVFVVLVDEYLVLCTAYIIV